MIGIKTAAIIDEGAAVLITNELLYIGKKT